MDKQKERLAEIYRYQKNTQSRITGQIEIHQIEITNLEKKSVSLEEVTLKGYLSEETMKAFITDCRNSIKLTTTWSETSYPGEISTLIKHTRSVIGNDISAIHRKIERLEEMSKALGELDYQSYLSLQTKKMFITDCRNFLEVDTHWEDTIWQE